MEVVNQLDLRFRNQNRPSGFTPCENHSYSVTFCREAGIFVWTLLSVHPAPGFDKDLPSTDLSNPLNPAQ